MTLTPDTKATVAISVLGALFIAGYGVSAALGDKADKSETEALRAKVHEMDKANSLLSQKIDYVIRDTTDANGKLDFIIKEMLRSREGNQQPPGATPNPLNR